MNDINDHYSLARDHNILTCRVSEHWTPDWARRYIDEIKSVAEGFNGQPWCRVINMQNFRLATPETIELIRAFGQWSRDNGCIEHVYLFSNAEQEAQVQQAFGGLFEIRSFDHEKDAVAYCQKKLRSKFLLDRNADVEARLA